jgi:glycerol-3-phosphate acyltransferase PlsX
MRISIAVDAMGGDHGPPVTVVASIRFEETPEASVILVGLEGTSASTLRGRSAAADRITVHAATEVIEMHEGPAAALRGKKDSRVAVNPVKDGTAQACVSAGNTGALMAISRLCSRPCRG